MAGRLEGNIDGTVTVTGRCRRGLMKRWIVGSITLFKVGMYTRASEKIWAIFFK
jgi:hypothetical protein